MKVSFLLGALFFLVEFLGAQEEVAENKVLWINLDYGILWPQADLRDRFGQSFSVGGGASYLSDDGLFLSIDYSLLFGNTVKEDVLSNLRTFEGGIIGRDRQFAEIFLRERGHMVVVEAGYFLGSKTMFHRSNLLLSAGVGWLQHKIRIVDDFDAVIQVAPPYDRGYDRLSTGVLLNQSVRYLYLSKSRLINFFFDVSLTEAFTKDRRQLNYNTAERPSDNRLDILMGAKFGWIIPIYLDHQ